MIDIDSGMVVRLRKQHPCGGDTWLVVRTGADIGIKCLTCQRQLMLVRRVFERRVKEVINGRQPQR